MAKTANKATKNPKKTAAVGDLFAASNATRRGMGFGLTVEVFSLTHSSTSVSILLLTFLVPALVIGAIAGVFVDRFDRRWHRY